MAFPGAHPPCPGLVHIEGDYLCKIVLAETCIPGDPVITKSLGIGAGCSMPDDSTTDQEIIRFDQISAQRIFGSTPE